MALYIYAVRLKERLYLFCDFFFFKPEKEFICSLICITRVQYIVVRCLYVLFHLMSTNERTKSALNSQKHTNESTHTQTLVALYTVRYLTSRTSCNEEIKWKKQKEKTKWMNCSLFLLLFLFLLWFHRLFTYQINENKRERKRERDGNERWRERGGEKQNFNCWMEGLSAIRTTFNYCWPLLSWWMPKTFFKNLNSVQ